jgi:hypothetical protein
MFVMKTEPPAKKGPWSDMLVIFMLFLRNVQWNRTVGPPMDKLLYFWI